jgi:branched-chain amino acid transport system substrate-binding protein
VSAFSILVRAAARVGLFVCLLFAAPAFAAETIKIGVLGVMSGPAASWGLVNKYCAEATANMYNAAGGVEIDGEKYLVEIVSIDDKNDPKLAVAGAERLVSQGVKYIIGPNVDTTAQSVVPVVERAGALHFPYAFDKKLYTPPRGSSILGMIASYQAGPIIYKYLRDEKGVASVSFVARNETDPLNQRAEGVAAAERLGLTIVSAKDTYEPGTSDFFPVMSRVVRAKPDLIVLSGVSPGDAPKLIKAARELGYTGLLSTETAQDIKVINEVAGAAADGFISVGGASTPEIASDYMRAFADEYVKVAGEWNDEAGTKVYALEIILRTLQKAGAAAIHDTSQFVAAMDSFREPNPLVNRPGDLKFVGGDYFGQRRQIGVPMIINEVRGGEFATIKIGAVE